MNFSGFKKKQSKSSAGFTIIELVIVFAVSAVIFGVVVSGYPGFLSKAELENIIFDVALTIREAQVYSVGAKEATPSNFDTAYGVYFDRSSPNQFILFNDDNDNKIYDGSEGINTFIIKSDFKIKLLCEDINCTISVARLDITFKRPNPDAVIISGGIPNGTPLSVGVVEIEGNRTNNTKKIIITDTGQISVP